MTVQLVILAAGEGKRMKTDLPKVMHKVGGKTMIDRILALVDAEDKAVVVVGHGRECLTRHIGGRAHIAVQEQQMGTGHAVMMARPFLAEADYTVVLPGDMPLLAKGTLQALIGAVDGHKAMILSSIVKDSSGYGRIIRDDKGLVQRIVEHRDATEEERAVKEINTAAIAFETKALLGCLDRLGNDNVQGEYYLTDCIGMLVEAGERVGALVAPEVECQGINDRVQLAAAEKDLRQRVNREYMLAGVTMIDPKRVYIEEGAQIGQDVILHPGVQIYGQTVIGDCCEIFGDSYIENCVIGHDSLIMSSRLHESKVGIYTDIGPNAYLRPQSEVGNHCKIGDFVELKAASIGDNTKVSHLTYIGDAEVGSDCNIGCGVVFVNFDGMSKYKTIVEDHCFIGCNVNLVSPVTVRQGAYVAAGTTVTEEVPADALSIGRARQSIKENWAEQRRREGKLR